MASRTCLLCLTLACIMTECAIASDSDNGFASLNCTENQGRLGQQSLLECIVVPSKEVDDISIDLIMWVKGDEKNPTMKYVKGQRVPESKPGFTLANLEEKLNVSMLITNTSWSHGGKYTCVVSTDRGHLRSSTTLNIIAPHTSPSISSTPHTSPSNRKGDSDARNDPKQEGSPNVAAKILPPVMVVVLAIGVLCYLIKRRHGRGGG